MAAPAKAKTRTDRTTERVRLAAVPVAKRPSRADRALRRTGRWLGSIDVAPRMRDELLAFALFTLAVVVALPLIGLAGDSLLTLLGQLNEQVLGRMAVAVPLGLSVIAVEVWREGEAGQRVRRLVGGVVAVVAAVGLLGLSDPDGAVETAGGHAGRAVALGLTRALGEVGAGLTFMAIGVVGVFLVTGYDTRSIAESWRRIRGRRRAELTEWADESDIEALVEAEPPAAKPAKGRSKPAAERNGTEPFTPTRTADLPAEPELAVAVAAVAEPVVAELPKRAPVIKVPKSDKAAREIRKAVSAVADPDQPLDAKAGWKLPSLEFLPLYESSAPDEVDLERKARRIEETLASFKVEATVREVFPGPAVTLFTLEPGVGVQVRRITALQNDLALALAAPSIRIEAPVPGMARVGIEIPNGSISTVGLRETLESSAFGKSNAKLPLPLGRDVNGRYIIGDLARMPHLLIAGSTGSGKSVCINGIIATFLLTKTPDDLRMVMIDPKMVELAGYEGVPHLKTPVVTEMDKVVGALRAVLREMERRYQLFSRLGVRNIDGYELRRSTEPALEKLPYLVLIIDELADLMMTTPDEVETILVRLCQMARATGIHVMIATQRPSVDVLTGLIKANVPARIAFAVASQTDSRVILDMPGAERLLGRGDMLFMPADAAKPHRIQGSFIDDAELQKLVKHWRWQAPEMSYEPEWEQLPIAEEEAEGSDDPLYEQALNIVRQQGTASASMLQRRLRIGYNRAARLIEMMEDDGVIGPADGSRGRPVLLDDGWDDE